jgi:hypothetical protein
MKYRDTSVSQKNNLFNNNSKIRLEILYDLMKEFLLNILENDYFSFIIRK